MDTQAREGGFAMVMAVLSITVAALLGIVAMQTSTHTMQTSAYDSARTQSVHAAEAGLDQMLSRFETAGTSALPCLLTGTLNATPVATFSVKITYYASYPLVGTPLGCVNNYLPITTVPAGAALVATGTVAGWKANTVERNMETQVKLIPVRHAFNKAIFSNASPSITNNLTIFGENGNDADMLTNGSWACANSLTIYGSIYVKETASLANSCHGAVDLWANGAITMSSQARIDHNLTSSTGSLILSNSASVGNNVTLGLACVGCTTGPGGSVGGSVTTGHLQGPPPTVSYPPMTFDSAAWTAEGWTVRPFTDCTAARAWLTAPGSSDSKSVLRITGGCTLSIQNNTTINRTADLAIFTDGEITTNNNTTWQSTDGVWHSLYLIVESAATCLLTDAVSGTGNGQIVMSNQTGFTKLYFFVYSPCGSTFAQNNSSARGQIYGQVVTLSNSLTYTFHAMFVPGAGDITGYSPHTAFVREID